MDKDILIVFAIVFTTAAASFFAGMSVGKSKNSQISPQFSQSRVNINSNRNGSGVASGEIIGADDTSVTVKSANGNTKIVFFSDKTKIGNFVDAAASDLTVGKSVMATGTANSDGSIVASNIQIGMQNFRSLPDGKTSPAQESGSTPAEANNPQEKEEIE